MLDLPALGAELRRRRRALRIPSAEFARRIGVSQTYVWLIEGARPRRSGEPSRPSEELLQRWTAALGMDADEARTVRELAGYFDVPEYDAPRAPRRMSPPVGASAYSAVETDSPASPATDGSPSSGAAPHLAALRRWARAAGGDAAGEAAMVERIHEIMDAARRSGRSEEVTYLLDSYLRWLATHIEADR